MHENIGSVGVMRDGIILATAPRAYQEADSHKALHETERPPRGGLSPKIIARSAGALGQASASPKGKVGLVAQCARGDLQRFVGDVEGKYFFLSLRGDIQH